MKLLFVMAGFLIFSDIVAAATRWPVAAKTAYIDRCAKETASQGMPQRNATLYCSCIADGMDTEFGLERYDQMMLAQPRRSGSADDKLLYKIFSACAPLLPAKSTK